MSNLTIDNVHSIVIQHAAFASGRRAIDQAYRRVGYSPSLLMSLLGESRSGKSTLLDTFMRQHQPSRGDQGVIAPILYFLTPTTITEKSLAFNILNELGDPLCQSSRRNDYMMTDRAVDLIQKCGVKAIFIDEIQHFMAIWTKTDVQKAANWLKNIAQKTRILLVVAGTPEGIGIFQSETQLERRAVQHISMPRFNWEDASSQAEFCGILKGYYKSLPHCSMPDIHKDRLAHAFWIASLGLTGLLADLLSKTIWNVHDKVLNLEKKLTNARDDEDKSFIQSELDRITTIGLDGQRQLVISVSDFELAFHETRGIEHVKIKNPFSELLGTKSKLANQPEPDFLTFENPKAKLVRRKSSKVLA